MTVNERIRYLRKDVLKMNQTEFAEAIGMKQRGASYIEQSGAGVTDKTIKTICLVFNINEDWLRDGKEPMYIQPPTFSLDDFVKQHGGTELEIDILKAYFELSPDVRKMLVQHFKSRLTASRAEPAATTVEEAEAAYIKSRSDTAQKTGLSASSSTADASRMESGAERASNL